MIFLQSDNQYIYLYIWISAEQSKLKIYFQHKDKILTSICLSGNVIEKYLKENFMLKFCVSIFKLSEFNITSY